MPPLLTIMAAVAPLALSPVSIFYKAQASEA
jgi:hypothetical protein